MPVYGRYEPTNDTCLLTLVPNTKRMDFCLYRDPRCRERIARFPWHYTETETIYRRPTVTVDCATYDLVFVGWRWQDQAVILACEGSTVATNPDAIMVETRRGWVDWPVRYSDGKIAYDAPERITKRQRGYVARLFKILEARHAN